ncbi:unnamed protein product [Citrullus colocynthis]|uniref:Transposase n=1 Tax=Citrullus colocynthis TaxID=252529 RepID=A0ABP0XMC7_9ROSI
MERFCVPAKNVEIHFGLMETMSDHLACSGFAREYICWIFHGESILDRSVSQNQVLNEFSVHKRLDVDERDNMQDMLQEAFGYFNENAFQGAGIDVDDMTSEIPDIDASNFLFLESGHKFRYDRRFDGTIEDQIAPTAPSSSIVSSLNW